MWAGSRLIFTFPKEKKVKKKKEKRKIAEASSLVSGEHEAKNTGVSLYLSRLVL